MKKFKWWIGLAIAVLTAVVGYLATGCSTKIYGYKKTQESTTCDSCFIDVKNPRK